MAESLIKAGISLCIETLRRLLHEMNIRPSANAKTLHGPDHPDRDAQFLHIKKMCEDFKSEEQPIISVDAQKRELIGNFKNNECGCGRWRYNTTWPTNITWMCMSVTIHQGHPSRTPSSIDYLNR